LIDTFFRSFIGTFIHLFTEYHKVNFQQLVFGT